MRWQNHIDKHQNQQKCSKLLKNTEKDSFLQEYRTGEDEKICSTYKKYL